MLNLSQQFLLLSSGKKTIWSSWPCVRPLCTGMNSLELNTSCLTICADMHSPTRHSMFEKHQGTRRVSAQQSHHKSKNVKRGWNRQENRSSSQCRSPAVASLRAASSCCDSANLWVSPTLSPKFPCFFMFLDCQWTEVTEPLHTGPWAPSVALWHQRALPGARDLKWTSNGQDS